MSLLAISTGLSILALIGLALGLAAALLVVALFNRVLRPAFEIERYAQDILEGAGGIAGNLDGVDKLVTTRDLATAVPGLAVVYLGQVKEKLP